MKMFLIILAILGFGISCLFTFSLARIASNTSRLEDKAEWEELYKVVTKWTKRLIFQPFFVF